VGGIKTNGNWRKRYNKGLMQLFGDFGTFSFIGLGMLNWIGYVNRMDSKRNKSQIFKNNPQGSRLSGRPPPPKKKKQIVELCTSRYS
jgi:hypothetical protein